MNGLLLPAMIFYMLGASNSSGSERLGAGTDEIQGSWMQVSKVRDGDQLEIKKTVLTFKGDTFETVREGTTVESGKIKVDSTKKPAGYSVTITGDFEEKGNTYNGIIELEGELLRTCVNTNAGKPAPTAFDSKKGTGYQFIVWKKVKP